MLNKKSVFLLCITCFLFVSCASSKRVDGNILEYQRQIDVLEARVSSYERTIDDAITELESIRRRAASIDGTIDNIIELFDDYQRTVERLLRNYREAAAGTGERDENSHCASGDTGT